MGMNLIRVAVTVVSFACFVAILAWVLAPRNRERFESAARIPHEEEG